MTGTRSYARTRDVVARAVAEEKVVVIGPGVVGMAMAALLAVAPASVADRRRRVVVIQRRSATSGWKIDAINSGRSSIGGIEPQLDSITADAVARGVLFATDDYGESRDADLIVVCVQTDRDGAGPDYGPLLAALHPLAKTLRERAPGHVPLVVIESTLAPSTMSTVVREHFASFGLVDGRDILIGVSPNRVMPGRLIERVVSADKLIGGLRPGTAERIAKFYGGIVTGGTLHQTNCLTAEVVKTLENAYRDVRIAYAAEVCRFCDDRDIDFFALREVVNTRLAQEDDASYDPSRIAAGGLLVPLLGVGGHCLPKDGVLLWWRALEQGVDATRSLLLEARHINSEAPRRAIELMERAFGDLRGKRVALLGVAYRPDSDDARNSPTLTLARLLRELAVDVRLHDPWVRLDDPNVTRAGFADVLTRDPSDALKDVDVAVLAVGHRAYLNDHAWLRRLSGVGGVFDAANVVPRGVPAGAGLRYAALARGRQPPEEGLIRDVVAGFRAVETGGANEAVQLVSLMSEIYAADEHERVSFEEVRRLAATCATGCRLGAPGIAVAPAGESGFDSILVRRALGTAGAVRWQP